MRIISIKTRIVASLLVFCICLISCVSIFFQKENLVIKTIPTEYFQKQNSNEYKIHKTNKDNLINIKKYKDKGYTVKLNKDKSQIQILHTVYSNRNLIYYIPFVFMFIFFIFMMFILP